MRNKMRWGLAALIFLLIGATLFVSLKNRSENRQVETDLKEAKELRQQNKEQPKEIAKEQPKENAPGTPPPVHGHADDTVHEDEQHIVKDTEPQIASKDYEPIQVEIPEGITDPEVLAAWERVQYIANNIWEWGGVPSAETEALINQLMPPPNGFSGPTGHSDAEETIDLLGSLDRNDPRSAAVMATYLCEGLVGGLGPKMGLVEMGVPAVPYLIPYMLDMELMPVLRSRALEVLCRIAEKHREELGGIVEHILIPRLEAILSEEKPDYFEEKDAKEYLPRLK